MHAISVFSKHLKRVLASALVVAGLVAALPGLSGCTAASSTASAVQSAVESALAPLQSLDAATVQSTLDNKLSEIDLAELQALGSDTASVLAQTFEGLDFAVSDVKIDGTSAQATITIKCKKPSDIASALGDAVRDAARDVSLDSLSPEGLQSMAGDLITQAVSETPVSTLDPIVVSLHQTNGKWQLDTASLSEITSAIAAS